MKNSALEALIAENEKANKAKVTVVGSCEKLLDISTQRDSERYPEDKDDTIESSYLETSRH